MNQLEQIKDALLFASAYISYVSFLDKELHTEANGTPACDGVVNNAISIIDTMLSAKMRSAEELEEVFDKENVTIISKVSIERIQSEAFAAGLAAQGKWQPIETAPKDGSMFLVCLPRQGSLIVRARFDKVHQYWLTDYASEGGICRPHFFHNGDLWQPLPAPPQKEGV